MRRYHIDLKWGADAASQDEEGELWPDVVTAQADALRILTDFARGNLQDRRPLTTATATVKDDDGPVFQIRLDLEILRLN